MPELIPQIINLELTNRCNLVCGFCDRQLLVKTMSVGEMDPALLRQILNSVKKHQIYELGLVGLGEPLLDRILPEHLSIIDEHAANFRRISMNSNAVAMDEKIAGIILGSKINMITFSLNATNREAYREMMGRDRFEQVVENIRNFISLSKASGRGDLKISIQFMSSDLNSGAEMDALFNGYLDQNIIVYDRHVFNKRILEQAEHSCVNINQKDSAGGRHPCWSMYSRVYIDRDGNVYPCTIGNDSYRTSSKLCIGNVKRETVIDIFNNEIMTTARSEAEKNDLPFDECGSCSLWALFPNNFIFRDGTWQFHKREDTRKKDMDRRD